MTSDCVFCKIAKREINAELVFSDENFVVFKDVKPLYPVHLLIVPKKHIDCVNDVVEDDGAFMGNIFFIASQLAKQFNVDKSGYRLVVNTNSDAGQVVRHFHMHFLAGEPLNGL